MNDFPDNPFGVTVTADSIIETMQHCDGWEERYRTVIQMGKKMPVMPDSLKQDQATIAGCESKVWLHYQNNSGIFSFYADSDARIVRGLIALVMAAFNHKDAQQIQAFDTEAYFDKLGMIAHLSPSRGNGLRAIVEQIKQITSA
ncbi:MAG: cysteine desulfurase sulfur acceptor subunit CsdE [Aliivibrio sp.]|uniref:cysteine desulfurase sulfur acceptor subunit CsdE n=1 Tax=Aliivibrio sp. TaxID=1872443 RepID=UPI001A5780A5|nr:cysteine desulfurase sulfur acceptor subunit CsdE [Aliivibrio sp.]